MFETVLVAARGPLAVRVVRTCQRLGVRAVSVHSEADARALHVTTADDAVLLGPAPPEHSYLDRRRVVEAARQCGASAVHPGGGALAADPSFARAVLDAGLAWVGADPEVLDRCAGAPPSPAVGRRLSVHLLAGPAVVPLAVVELSPDEGAPLTGRAPAPGVAALDRVEALAVRAATGSGVRGVATAEVRLRPDGGVALEALRPWLPVEHALSEELCGLDLVEQQLRLAQGPSSGDSAPPASSPSATSVRQSGQAALLLRVYAEPATHERRVTAWRPPAGVRVDSGIGEGEAVLPWYDPLLTTVTVVGPTPEHALASAREAVDGFVVAGVQTTLPRLAAVLAGRTLRA